MTGEVAYPKKTSLKQCQRQDYTFFFPDSVGRHSCLVIWGRAVEAEKQLPGYNMKRRTSAACPCTTPGPPILLGCVLRPKPSGDPKLMFSPCGEAGRGLKLAQSVSSVKCLFGAHFYPFPPLKTLRQLSEGRTSHCIYNADSNGLFCPKFVHK